MEPSAVTAASEGSCRSGPALSVDGGAWMATGRPGP